ncbi:YcdB/YcdC domain-containing protein [Aneurinibacillus danicus]|uniref:YcdB/YcdC repeated domain-containing protein n=1 Tax=Aneurinibacillus danicus TaxID=267746 RepID=A0A511V7Q1_9BACL|nr:YcdB/YcdC domain-containing protein [Aneurinibacillus danicus]GEN34900.1 hypothetical protein ADA01nite_23600 [Aneurinibacillus danicus]
MKYSLPLAALLLASSLVPAVPALAAGTESEIAQPAASVKSTEHLAPIPPAVQKSMDKLFSLQPELKRLHVTGSYPSEGDGRFVVTLSNQKPEEAWNPKGLSNAHLIFDNSTGELLGFDLQIWEWASDKMPSRQLTLEAADRFLTEWFGAENRQKFGKPESNGAGSSTTHHDDGTKTTWATRHAEFPLVLNGLPVSGGGGPHLGVDSFGHVVNYTYTPIDLDNISVPKPNTARPAEEIKQKAVTADSIDVSYIEAQPEKYTRLSVNTKTKPVLRYDFQRYGYLHPVTGKPIDTLSGKEIDKNRQPSVSKQEVTLQPKGQPIIVRSEDEAKQLIGQLLGMADARTKLRTAEHRVPENNEDNPQQMYEFDTEDHQIFSYVLVDKRTGQVQHASVQVNREPQEQAAKVTKEEAYATALSFLQTYASPTAKQLESIDFSWEEPELPAWVDKSKLPEGILENQSNEYSFFFQEMHQGIPVQDRSYQVTVDKQTGKVVGFSLAVPKEKLELPDAKNIVTKTQAVTMFLKNEALKLQYIWPQYMNQRAPAPILVYGWDNSKGYGYVDATTGEYVNVPVEWDEE